MDCHKRAQRTRKIGIKHREIANSKSPMANGKGSRIAFGTADVGRQKAQKTQSGEYEFSGCQIIRLMCPLPIRCHGAHGVTRPTLPKFKVQNHKLQMANRRWQSVSSVQLRHPRLRLGLRLRLGIKRGCPPGSGNRLCGFPNCSGVRRRWRSIPVFREHSCLLLPK